MSLCPEYMFSAFDEMTPDFLEQNGFRCVILDIDNTLEPYENPDPGERVRAWFEALGARGIRCAFVSNNDKERVERFNRDLGFPAYAKAKKPFSKYVKRVLREMGCTAKEAVLMGDQIFTDVLAAHAAGIRAALVPPIRDKRDLLTRSKRVLERPILRRARRKIRKEKEKTTE